MADCRTRPQWHSLCVRGLEVQSKHEAVQQLVRTSLGHHWRNCEDEGYYVRPNCLSFLEELGKIASISVWSSMKIWNIEGIVNYLFPKGKLPCLVLAQDSCTTIRCRDSSGQLTTFMVPGTQKEFFLKNLDTLFCGYRRIFNLGNTTIVDDSPLKHIMNRPENMLLPNPWSNRGNGDRDTFLLHTLLPWFQ